MAGQEACIESGAPVQPQAQRYRTGLCAKPAGRRRSCRSGPHRCSANQIAGRFRPHVRAAYLGPTPDNPSLSLKYRLRRAAAMDQRARLEGREAPVQPAVMPAQPSRQPMPQWNANRSSFMFRRADKDIARRPAFQK